jgi:hypothetical protein
MTEGIGPETVRIVGGTPTSRMLGVMYNDGSRSIVPRGHVRPLPPAETVGAPAETGALATTEGTATPSTEGAARPTAAAGGGSHRPPAKPGERPIASGPPDPDPLGRDLLNPDDRAAGAGDPQPPAPDDAGRRDRAKKSIAVARAAEDAPRLAKPGEDLCVGPYVRSRRADETPGLQRSHSPHHIVQDAVSPSPTSDAGWCHTECPKDAAFDYTHLWPWEEGQPITPGSAKTAGTRHCRCQYDLATRRLLTGRC